MSSQLSKAATGSSEHTAQDSFHFRIYLNFVSYNRKAKRMHPSHFNTSNYTFILSTFVNMYNVDIWRFIFLMAMLTDLYSQRDAQRRQLNLNTIILTARIFSLFLRLCLSYTLGPRTAAHQFFPHLSVCPSVCLVFITTYFSEVSDSRLCRLHLVKSSLMKSAEDVVGSSV